MKTTFVMNDMSVKNLKPETKEFTRREKGGFGVRVHPSGTKTLFYLYRIAGQRRFLNLGEYYDAKHKGEPKGKRVTLSEARAIYELERKKVELFTKGQGGSDPVKVKHDTRQQLAEQHKAHTVADLIQEFLDKWVKKKKSSRSAYNDERALNTDVLPRWGKIKASDIRRRDAILLLEQVAERAPGQARYLVKVCRKMFSFGIQREIVEVNPFTEMVTTIPELRHVRRERTLSADEIRTVWEGIEKGFGCEETKAILKLILVTGQRPSEVCGIRKSEIDGNWWTIPAERMKNRKPHRVFLTPLAKSLIPEAKDEVIFSTREGRKPKNAATGRQDVPIHVGTLSYAVKRSNFYNVGHWTPHDLRRTCRTFLAEIGIPREHAEAVLSHALQGVEGTYNRHHYDKEKKQALEAWERKLNSIILPKECNVIPLLRKS